MILAPSLNLSHAVAPFTLCSSTILTFLDAVPYVAESAY